MVKKLSARRVNPERLGFAVTKEGIIPSIRVNESFFQKLFSAGTIDNVSRISVHQLGEYFFAELYVKWPSIKEKITIIFDGWRDRSWLVILCTVKKIAFTTHRKLGPAVMVNNINTDNLKMILVVSSLFPSRNVVNNPQQKKMD